MGNLGSAIFGYPSNNLGDIVLGSSDTVGVAIDTSWNVLPDTAPYTSIFATRKMQMGKINLAFVPQVARKIDALWNTTETSFNPDAICGEGDTNPGSIIPVKVYTVEEKE